MLNILLTNASIKNGNKGCVALTVSALYLIDELMREKMIQYKIYVYDSGYNDMEKRTIANIEYYSCLKTDLWTFVKSLKSVKRIKSYITNKKNIENADFLLDVGLGDSFADIYGKNRFYAILSKYTLARRYRIPYCIMPQTIGPYSDESICKKAFRIIDSAKYVMVRDHQSFDFIKKYLPEKVVTEAVDMAFFMPYTKRVFNSKYIHVGLNVSALLWHGGYTRDNQFGLSVDYQKVVRNIISYFLSIPNIKLHLIPHVVGSEKGVENDYAVSYDLQQEIGDDRIILSPLFFDPIEAKSYISGMDFFMGARMHSTIAAFSTGVTVVPMAYSRKFNGLFVETLAYPNMCDMKSESETAILTKIENAFVSRKEIKDIIDNRMSTIVADGKRKIMIGLETFFGL